MSTSTRVTTLGARDWSMLLRNMLILVLRVFTSVLDCFDVGLFLRTCALGFLVKLISWIIKQLLMIEDDPPRAIIAIQDSLGRVPINIIVTERRILVPIIGVSGIDYTMFYIVGQKPNNFNERVRNSLVLIPHTTVR